MTIFGLLCPHAALTCGMRIFEAVIMARVGYSAALRVTTKNPHPSRHAASGRIGFWLCPYLQVSPRHLISDSRLAHLSHPSPPESARPCALVTLCRIGNGSAFHPACVLLGFGWRGDLGGRVGLQAGFISRARARGYPVTRCRIAATSTPSAAMSRSAEGSRWL
jgi:hypothetical protein